MPDAGTVPPPSAVGRYARWAGLLTGLVGARQIEAHDDLGVGVLNAISVFGLCAVAGVLVGDALAPRPRGTSQGAGHPPRRVRDYLPRRMTLVLLVQAGALVVLLAVAALVASPDGLGRAGRALTMRCPDGSVTRTGPWPGPHYDLPILAALAVSTGACVWFLARIARHPGEEQARHDRALVIVAAWGLLVSAHLLGTATTACDALMDMDCGGAAGNLANWVLWPTAIFALGTVAWCGFTVVSHKARVPR